MTMQVVKLQQQANLLAGSGSDAGGGSSPSSAPSVSMSAMGVVGELQ